MLNEAKRICDQLVRLDMLAYSIPHCHHAYSFKTLVNSLVNHHHPYTLLCLTHLHPKPQQPHLQQQRLSHPPSSPTLPHSSCHSVCLELHSLFILRCTLRPRHDTQPRLTINIPMLLVTIQVCRPRQLPYSQRRPPLHPPQHNSSLPRLPPLLQR
jgi:hypothetical protein